MGEGMALAIILDWIGPFDDYDDFKSVVKDWDGDDILYMALREYNKITYIGLSRSSVHRFSNHPKMGDQRNKQFWFAEIVSQRSAGRKQGGQSVDLQAAEQFLIQYIDPELNSRHRGTNPADCISIFSRFFSTSGAYDGDWETIDGLKKFPKLLAWDSYKKTALKAC